jgi:hypothetical protein
LPREGGREMREDAKKLIEMVRKRVPDKEIMEKLGIQTKASLKKMYYDALVESGKIKDIVSKQDAETKRILKVSTRGTLSLSRKLVVDDFAFQEGDKFTVSKRKDSIILRKEAS